MNHARTGKPAPIDWQPTEGGDVIINLDGQTYRKLSKLEAELYQGGDAVRSHLTTCPKRHRPGSHSRRR